MAVNNAYDLHKQSQYFYHDAEQILIKDLGFVSFELSDKSIARISFSDSFGKSGRLDAEYYQPAYDDIERQIRLKFTNQASIDLHDDNFIPQEDAEYNYIELADIGKSGEIMGAMRGLGKELPSRARRQVKDSQVIVSSIEGSLDSCALINKEQDNYLCSTGFYVVDSTDTNPETLLLLYKNTYIQKLLKKHCSGTILPGISKPEFERFSLPLISQNIQNGIATKVQESFALRKKSEQLLESAKTAVEMAIEQGEDEAVKFLKETANE
jgi:hypothetical protein